jgi:hypothetical protein
MANKVSENRFTFLVSRFLFLGRLPIARDGEHASLITVQTDRVVVETVEYLAHPEFHLFAATAPQMPGLPLIIFLQAAPRIASGGRHLLQIGAPPIVMIDRHDVGAVLSLVLIIRTDNNRGRRPAPAGSAPESGRIAGLDTEGRSLPTSPSQQSRGLRRTRATFADGVGITWRSWVRIELLGWKQVPSAPPMHAHPSLFYRRCSARAREVPDSPTCNCVFPTRTVLHSLGVVHPAAWYFLR